MSRVQSSSSASTVGIKDTAGNPLTSTAGALDVNIVSSGPPGTQISQYSTISSVAMGGTATVLIYTVGAGVSLLLNRIAISSDSICEWDLQFNNITNAIKRMSYTGPFNANFDYMLATTGYELSTGTVITLLATNYSTAGLATFDATLQGILI